MFKIDKRYAKANNQKTIRFTDDLYMQLQNVKRYHLTNWFCNVAAMHLKTWSHWKKNRYLICNDWN